MFLSLVGLIGAWLLVAGGIYQAALDLRAHEIARDRIHAIARKTPIAPPLTTWWRFVPPVKFFHERERHRAHREAFMEALSFDDFSRLLGMRNKAYGWLFVAGGAFLLALKETYQMTVYHRLGVGCFVAIALGMSVLSGIAVLVLLVQSDRLTARKKTGN